jgi:predicted regulator of Ras-like GTPase activity (Roadblock/LC7/MglB family)
LKRPVESGPPPRPTPAVSFDDLTFGYVDDQSQLALRAIFATEKSLTPRDVVDLSAQLPGVRACLIITPDGVTRSGGAEDSDEARHFAEKAGPLFHKTSSLIEELDLGAEQMFTLRTGKGVMSFFTNGKLCLAVLHATPSFQPGVREKLILITRELAKLPAT